MTKKILIAAAFALSLGFIAWGMVHVHNNVRASFDNGYSAGYTQAQHDGQGSTITKNSNNGNTGIIGSGNNTVTDSASPMPGSAVVSACVGGYRVFVDTRYATTGTALTVPDQTCPGYHETGVATTYLGD